VPPCVGSGATVVVVSAGAVVVVSAGAAAVGVVPAVAPGGDPAFGPQPVKAATTRKLPATSAARAAVHILTDTMSPHSFKLTCWHPSYHENEP